MKRAIRIIFLLALLLVVAEYTLDLRWRLFHRRGKLPSSVAECLAAPQQMVLYSIDPNLLRDDQPGTKFFHNYAVVGEVEITSPDTRRVVAQTVLHAVSAWNGRYMACFNPRHGIRVTSGTQTYDLLICFECQHIYSFSGEQQVGETGLTGSQAPLDEILRTAQVPLPK